MLEFILPYCPSAAKEHGLPHGHKSNGDIRRMLNKEGYHPFCGEEKIVKYIEGVATDPDEGTDNLFRSILTSLAI